MKYRGPIAVFFLSFFTLGIYAIVWQVKTKGEMNRLGAKIPTAWLIIVPFVSIWWLWKYSEGVELVTKNEMSTVIAFILLALLGVIGMAIVQNEFNSILAKQAQGITSPPAPPAPPTAAAPPTLPTSSTPPAPPAPPTTPPVV